MPEELSIREYANSPEQIAASLYVQVSRIIARCPDNAFKRFSDGDSHYRITPSVSPDGHDYAIAEILGKGDKTTGIYYLVIDDAYTNIRIQFGKRSLDKALYDPVDNTSLDPKSVQGIVDRLESAVNTIINQAHRSRTERWHTVRKWLIVFSIIGVIGGGIYWWIDSVVSEHAEQRAAAEKSVQDYDAKNVVLRGTRVPINSSAQVVNDPPNIASNAPRLGTIGRSPRSASIMAGECNTLGHIAVSGEYVIAVSDAPLQNVIVSVMSDGRVDACAIDNDAGTTKDSNGHVTAPNYTILIQSQPVSG